MRRLNILGLVALIVISGSAFAQPDSLVTYTGTVINNRTGEPIPGIAVSYKKLP